ncbi:MAG: hypothetical protein HYY26_02770 [Acidobacteria bacterium]|nr:hypothetical protein [Acidobacteriota bacterium]
MKADEVIQVKFSEDLAQFAELRPVRRQPMTLRELVGLVLTSTGKNRARLRAHLESGNCPYNIYRYWWQGFTIDDAALEAILAEFPDPDPARAFRAEDCAWVSLFDAQEPTPHSVVIEKQEAARRRWFRRQSFWDVLMELASRRPPVYLDYSYYHRADLYRLELSPDDLARLRQEGRRLATRRVLDCLGRRADWVRLELACPRRTARQS